ncbi:MAG: hypothetical protein IPK12_24335 [Gemmatimonadetes bacterium]|nr:hypothetical protein [Gemmatimonadota bacterium]
MPRPLIAALLAGAVAVPLAAQGNPAPRALKSPDAKFEEPFDQVVALRELANGRVLVTDVAAKAVLLADFRTQAHSQVGRSGQGPGEYNLPGDLIALAGDTTLVVDRGNRRMLVVTPDGKMGATITFPRRWAASPTSAAPTARAGSTRRRARSPAGRAAACALMARWKCRTRCRSSAGIAPRTPWTRSARSRLPR